jgi:hypothetical protein
MATIVFRPLLLLLELPIGRVGCEFKRPDSNQGVEMAG